MRAVAVSADTLAPVSRARARVGDRIGNLAKRALSVLDTRAPCLAPSGTLAHSGAPNRALMRGTLAPVSRRARARARARAPPLASEHPFAPLALLSAQRV